ELGVLPANDKTCFLVSFDEFNGWSHFEFETPTYYSTTDNWLRNMVVYGDNGTYDPNNGSYRILGFVRNDNDIQIQSVQPIVTLYDA
ncbi:MAG: hypothetical protein GWN00_10085, partial [Aliifodinibius sp.]|nr:hypothetical protein [Fodinibius sp.]NIX02628.1 hypothetical protein [Phycisphaerae bacterium]NIY25138.1 hypothetical protein [Fodinibius sp.]